MWQSMEKVKLFLDTEFTELSRYGKLISLAVVSEKNDIFYAELNHISENVCNEWVKENVLPRLLFPNRKTHFSEDNATFFVKDSPVEISHKFSEWLSRFGEIEIFGDCPAFDWVLLCDLFGTAFDIPENIFYIPFDVATLLRCTGIDPDINREQFVRTNKGDYAIDMIKKKAKGPHNSLFDAFIIKYTFEILENMK